jgi:hypothetical protein
MSQVIIYRQSNGRVAICTPILNNGLTIEEIAVKDIPSGFEYRIINSSELPTDSTFYNAWIYGSQITMDTVTTQDIQKNKWRRAREPILQRLDVEFMRALELGQSTAEIAAKKQTLRDVTNTPLPEWNDTETVDSYTTKVKAVWPDCLNW